MPWFRKTELPKRIYCISQIYDVPNSCEYVEYFYNKEAAIAYFQDKILLHIPRKDYRFDFHDMENPKIKIKSIQKDIMNVMIELQRWETLCDTNSTSFRTKVNDCYFTIESFPISKDENQRKPWPIQTWDVSDFGDKPSVADLPHSNQTQTPKPDLGQPTQTVNP